LSYLWGQKHYNVPYPVKQLFLYVVFALAIFFVSLLFKTENVWSKTIINSLLLFLFLMVVFFKERKNVVKKKG